MKITVSKNLLLAAILASVTACGSSGGGGSNVGGTPSTSNSKENITVPVVNKVDDEKANSSTSNSTNIASENLSNFDTSTFSINKEKDDVTGKAIYANPYGAKFYVDFDKRIIYGSTVGNMKDGTVVDINFDKVNMYKDRYSIRGGQVNSYGFSGNATGIARETSEQFKGSYGGEISSYYDYKRLDFSYSLKSEKDATREVKSGRSPVRAALQ